MLYFLLLGGDFPVALKDRAVGPAATILIKGLGVSELFYGLIIIGFPNFTNLFLSPVISFISDRHRGRWGRRIPFLMFTTPFIVLGLYLLGLSRLLGGWLHSVIPEISEHTAILIIFSIAWILLDFGTTLSGSLFGALVKDVVPLELIGRFFGLFRIVSLTAGILFNGWLIGRVETHMLEIFLGIGTLYLVGFLLLCFKVKEGEYPPPEDILLANACRETVLSRVIHSVLIYLRQSFSLSYYRWLMLAMTLGMISCMPINFFSIQYAGKLGINLKEYGGCLMITYICSLLLGYPLGVLADRFHPIRCGIVSMTGYFIVMIAGWFWNDMKYFEIIFILHGVISGSYMTLTASLSYRLLPRNLFAQLRSAIGLILSVSIMLLGPALGAFLDLVKYDYCRLFLFGGFLAFLAVLSLLKVYRNFMENGGDADYRPPMPH